jgi:hypothetical protein
MRDGDQRRIKECCAHLVEMLDANPANLVTAHAAPHRLAAQASVMKIEQEN